jgi:DNA-binding response OmpR family regulator
MKLLWVDDDSYKLLEPLSRLLTDGGFTVARAISYTAAIHSVEAEVPDALLLDTILPHSNGHGALADYLGLALAQYAAERGVPKIAFLTVVRRDEIIDRYDELKKAHTDTQFSYFDKTTLLEPNQIEHLIARLR